MNLPDPQAIANAWMSQLSDPGRWQSWFGAAPTTNLNPLSTMLQDVGASVKPDAMEQLKNAYLEDFGSLWQDFLAGKTPTVTDRRFSSPAWQTNSLSSFNAASYLLNARFLTAMVDTVETSVQQKHKLRFAVQQIVDAMSPANFLATNPEAQQKLITINVQRRLHGLDQTLSIDLLLAQHTGHFVITRILKRILEHLGDFTVGQTIRRFDLDACLNPRTQFARRHAKQTIRINLEGHTYFRRTRHHRRNTTQLEACQ